MNFPITAIDMLKALKRQARAFQQGREALRYADWEKLNNPTAELAKEIVNSL